jgi:hypothetical protein
LNQFSSVLLIKKTWKFSLSSFCVNLNMQYPCYYVIIMCFSAVSISKYLTDSLSYYKYHCTYSFYSYIIRFDYSTLINELFTGTWQYSSNNSKYYSLSAPSTCWYIYVKENDIVYMLTTFLSLYGRINVFVWYRLYFYRQLFKM